ncbi:hypothetical protein P13BB106kb_p076 [Pectobacterium phage DU_PP_V]|uniref:Uncharacterized protein n=1 Tax=Pectobacterium phage DU_PP_V TaxID=2041492 RepID=A0A2D2W792_9CAUD|nr:hypothetical protein HOS40_gp093 [Pectobacterium phage DU_PP_V]ATS94060.1 hypothetical protein P13BB106kb_p076 [Pectobacterium phage DU_PP_V]
MTNVYKFRSAKEGTHRNLELANSILARMDEDTRLSLQSSVMEAARLAYSYRSPSELMRKAMEINLNLTEPELA